MEKNYYKIDVQRGFGCGYSFMVCSVEDWDDEDIINECKARELFDEEDDSEFVVEIDRNVDEYDISHLMEFIYDLDE